LPVVLLCVSGFLDSSSLASHSFNVFPGLCIFLDLNFYLFWVCQLS
jgi:hypothetical protein